MAISIGSLAGGLLGAGAPLAAGLAQGHLAGQQEVIGLQEAAKTRAIQQEEANTRRLQAQNEALVAAKNEVGRVLLQHDTYRPYYAAGLRRQFPGESEAFYQGKMNDYEGLVAPYKAALGEWDPDRFSDLIRQANPDPKTGLPYGHPGSSDPALNPAAPTPNSWGDPHKTAGGEGELGPGGPAPVQTAGGAGEAPGGGFTIGRFAGLGPQIAAMFNSPNPGGGLVTGLRGQIGPALIAAAGEQLDNSHIPQPEPGQLSLAEAFLNPEKLNRVLAERPGGALSQRFAQATIPGAPVNDSSPAGAVFSDLVNQSLGGGQFGPGTTPGAAAPTIQVKDYRQSLDHSGDPTFPAHDPIPPAAAGVQPGVPLPTRERPIGTPGITPSVQTKPVAVPEVPVSASNNYGAPFQHGPVMLEDRNGNPMITVQGVGSVPYTTANSVYQTAQQDQGYLAAHAALESYLNVAQYGPVDQSLMDTYLKADGAAWDKAVVNAGTTLGLGTTQIKTLAEAGKLGSESKELISRALFNGAQAEHVQEETKELKALAPFRLSDAQLDNRIKQGTLDMQAPQLGKARADADKARADAQKAQTEALEEKLKRAALPSQLAAETAKTWGEYNLSRVHYDQAEQQTKVLAQKTGEETLRAYDPALGQLLDSAWSKTSVRDIDGGSAEGIGMRFGSMVAGDTLHTIQAWRITQRAEQILHEAKPATVSAQDWGNIQTQARQYRDMYTAALRSATGVQSNGDGKLIEGPTATSAAWRGHDLLQKNSDATGPEVKLWQDFADVMDGKKQALQAPRSIANPATGWGRVKQFFAGHAP